MISHHKAKDVLIIADVIIVAMRKSEMQVICKLYYAECERETEIICAGWELFNMTHQIPRHQPKKLPPF